MKPYSDFLIELSLGQAAAYADKAHKGQHRKTSGAPYITHPMKVVRILQSVGIKDKSTLVAAFLHDTVEDSNTSFNDLEREFNKEISKTVKELTSIPRELNKIGKEAYLADKMISMRQQSLSIKLADRLHNVEDLNSMSALKAQKYADSTFYIIRRIKEGRVLNKNNKKLIRKIEKKIAKYRKR